MFDKTVCPGSSNPFYIIRYYKKRSLLPGHTVTYYIKGATTSWTHSKNPESEKIPSP